MVTITGHHLQGDLDPAFYVHRGTYTDTEQFSGSLSNNAPLAFADDELPPALPGPFGDPRTALQLPEGTYTISFVSFDNSGPGPFAYCLELNGPATNCSDHQVPMPATLLLLALGSIGIGSLRYGRFAR